MLSLFLTNLYKVLETTVAHLKLESSGDPRNTSERKFLLEISAWTGIEDQILIEN